VIDLDVQKFFDSVRWDLLVKAVEAHTDAVWVVLYVKRWLRAPLQLPDGTLQEGDRGTPQGSPVSPVLANLFMHYAFDAWLAREFPAVQFERYADGGAPRTLTEVAMWKIAMSGCGVVLVMEVWPSGTALQGEVSNHRKLLRSRAVVVSVAEKAHEMRQV
jgi:hypothetical protein